MRISFGTGFGHVGSAGLLSLSLVVPLFFPVAAAQVDARGKLTIIVIEGESYRMREARERAAKKKKSTPSAPRSVSKMTDKTRPEEC